MILPAAFLVLLALPVQVQAQGITSGNAVLDAAWIACRRHAEGSGYAAGFADCDRVVTAWDRTVARYKTRSGLKKLDAEFYAGAEPASERDRHIINRALSEFR